jgi:archaellin
LNNRGTLNAKLGLNPSDFTNLKLDLTIENFLLSDINIYSNYYTGHNIVKGDFYYYSQSTITNGNIQSENKLLVKNVSVVNNKSGLATLPLKFALFLLKDKNGDVNLDIPVRGDLNDPKVSVGKIVWNTFKNLIVKTVASPVNFLAGLVDGDPKEFEEIKFSYTDSIPNEKQFRKLDKLLEMESKKEGLKIELVHFVDPDLQREAIAYSELGKQYFIDTNKDYLKNDKDFEAYIKTKAGSDSLDIKTAIYQLIKPQTADSLANLYNSTLIKTTQDYLIGVKDSTNITVLKSEPREPDNSGSLSRFKITYNMLEEDNTEQN